MMRLVVLTFFLSSILISGCYHPDNSKSEVESTKLRAEHAKKLLFTVDALAPTEYHPVQARGVFHPDMRGVWQARGYGYVFDIGEKECHWYSVTKDHAWDHTPDDPIDMVFGVERPSGRRYIKPYDTESALILEPLPALPEQCRQPSETGPLATLDRIDQTMIEFYPFFAERNHDWQQKMAEARSKVTSSMAEAELFDLVEVLFDGLGDGHTSVAGEIGGESRETKGGMSSIRRALEADFKAKEGTIERKDYFGDWSRRLFTGIKEELLHGKAQAAFNENIIWGKITPQVGYLLIRDMASYGDESEGLVGNLGRLHKQLAKLFESFADCDAVIIDVSFNMGGYHSFALAFVSHIADRERFVLSKYPKDHPDLLQKYHVRPYCDGRGNIKTFTKPVYVVTSDACVSAGEEFVIAARSFPHVKVVGTRTQGMLSDMLEKPLPNGWTLNMSNEFWLNQLGESFEVVGVPVDIEKQIFDVDNIHQIGHADSILKLSREIVGHQVVIKR